MNPVPDFIPILSDGKHKELTEGACAMEMVAFLAGEEHSDRPACTNPFLAALARSVNDHLDDADRQQLAPLLPSLIGTNDGDPVVEVRLGVWCALEVVDLIEDEHLRGLSLEAIYAAEAWCDDPSKERSDAAFVAMQKCRAAAGLSTVVFAAMTAACVVARATRLLVLPLGVEVQSAANKAVLALDCAGRTADLADFLAGAIAEHRRLTDPKPPVADALDWAGLSEAMEGVR